MEVHQLKYFVAVAETGSFSRAAERCYVSQPSLSQQIIKLEQELGQPLFDRTSQGVLLTHAGRLLLGHARLVLMTLDDAARELECAREQGCGKLSVGMIPTIAPFLLPRVLDAFLSERPRLELTVREDYTQRLVDGLCDGSLDVAIAALPIDGASLETEPLGDDPLLLAMRSDHDLAKQKRVKVDDVRNERFVLISEMHCLGEQTFSFCRQKAFNPGVVCESSQISTVQALVALGQGVSLLPAMASRENVGGKLVYSQFADERPSRTIVAVRHRQRYQIPEARAFVDAVKAHLTSDRKNRM